MNPIIFLWAHPRSMSTAIERVMRERGDFDCLHEPFLHYYYLERSGKRLPHFAGRRKHPSSYADTRDMVLRRAERAPVFAKDMSYYVIPELLEDREFCARLRHCFLIRDPRRALLSYYRLDPSLTLAEVGIEAQWRHFEGLMRLGIDDAVLLEAEAVQADSAAQMRRFWDALGLDFRARALRWERAAVPADWSYVAGWHETVSASGGIRADAADAAGSAAVEFENLACEVPRLRAYLDHHLPFYRRLREFSLSAAG